MLALQCQTCVIFYNRSNLPSSLVGAFTLNYYSFSMTSGLKSKLFPMTIPIKSGLWKLLSCSVYETKKCYNDNTSLKPTNTNIVAHCSSKTCPGEGFVGKDCKCWCKGTADPRNKPVVECDGGEITGTRPPVTPSPVTPAPVTPSPGNVDLPLQWWPSTTAKTIDGTC